MTKVKIDYMKYDNMRLKFLIKSQDYPKRHLEKIEKEQYENEKLLEFLDSRICEVIDNIKPQKRIQKYAQYYKLDLIKLTRIYDKIIENQKILTYNKIQFENLQNFLTDKICYEMNAPQYGLYKNSLLHKTTQNFKKNLAQDEILELQQRIDKEFKSVFEGLLLAGTKEENKKCIVEIYRGADKNAGKYFHTAPKTYFMIDYFITKYLINETAIKFLSQNEYEYWNMDRKRKITHYLFEINNYAIRAIFEENKIQIQKIVMFKDNETAKLSAMT